MTRRQVILVALVPAIIGAVVAFSVDTAQCKPSAARRSPVTTQQWVLYKASAVAAAQGITWLDRPIAAARANRCDAAFGSDNVSYSAGRWSKARVRSAAKSVADDYADVVAALRAGDTQLASWKFGELAHTFADLSNPIDTDSCRAELKTHRGWTLRTRYDASVRRALNRAHGNRVNRAARGLAVSGISSSVARRAATSAVLAHRDYRRLVLDYSRNGFDAPVQRIAARNLRRAVAGLAGVIVQAWKDSKKHDATPTPTPDPVAPAPSDPPTVSPTPSDPPTPPPAPAGGVIDVPGGATKAQIDACVAKAVAAGPGTTVVFPAGKFAYSGTFVVPDYINVSGQGIWDQSSVAGGGGTWLQCTRGMDWGSYSTIQDLLVGQNTPGVTCNFKPVPRGSGAAGACTRANGSQHCVFSFVRFKGGSDTGAQLIDLGDNWGSGRWSGPVETYDMIDTDWYDCEFERPQSTNSVDGTDGSLGNVMNIWLDCRAGGGRVYGDHWYRCHFGVKNGYHSGVDGYGLGGTVLFQPAPAEHAVDGPRPSGGANNMHFDWSRVDHGFYDNSFQDCLFEYSLWCPADICDYARSYSLTTFFGGVAGSNPPIASQAAAIPDRFWNLDFSVTGCYFKGSTSTHPIDKCFQSEFCKDLTITDTYCGTGFYVFAGNYGNVVSGSLDAGARPATPIFTANWTGTTTSYTPSPYDP